MNYLGKFYWQSFRNWSFPLGDEKIRQSKINETENKSKAVSLVKARFIICLDLIRLVQSDLFC